MKTPFYILFGLLGIVIVGGLIYVSAMDDAEKNEVISTIRLGDIPTIEKYQQLDFPQTYTVFYSNSPYWEGLKFYKKINKFRKDAVGPFGNERTYVLNSKVYGCRQYEGIWNCDQCKGQETVEENSFYSINPPFPRPGNPTKYTGTKNIAGIEAECFTDVVTIEITGIESSFREIDGREVCIYPNLKLLLGQIGASPYNRKEEDMQATYVNLSSPDDSIFELPDRNIEKIDCGHG